MGRDDARNSDFYMSAQTLLYVRRAMSQGSSQTTHGALRLHTREKETQTKIERTGVCDACDNRGASIWTCFRPHRYENECWEGGDKFPIDGWVALAADADVPK